MGCHFFPQFMKVKGESEVTQLCPRLLATPWTAAYQAPPSMGFSRQEYWSGVPLPSPREALGPANCVGCVEPTLQSGRNIYQLSIYHQISGT